MGSRGSETKRVGDSWAEISGWTRCKLHFSTRCSNDLGTYPLRTLAASKPRLRGKRKGKTKLGGARPEPPTFRALPMGVVLGRMKDG